MHIAVVSNTAWYLFNFRLNLMRALVAQGHEVVAIAPHDMYAEFIRAAGVTFESVPLSGAGLNPLREARTVWALGKLFRRHRIDVVLSYTPKGNLYSAIACMANRLPFIPNVSGLGRAFTQPSIVTHVARLLYRLTFRHAHHVFFQNLDDMQAFVTWRLVSPAKASRLPGSGVDLSHFSPQPMPAKGPDVGVRFLLVARLLWDKGIGEYVAAARRVLAVHPQTRFSLLGQLGVDNPSAIAEAQIATWVAAGTIRYLGATDDVRPHLAHADCVVLPSYREGVPRTLLEAAATARPVITTDAPGCRDTVRNGVTGFMCQPKDAVDLARQMLAFIDLPTEDRQSMGQQGRALMESAFSEQIVLGQYLARLQDLARAP